jgi:uncharacterized protein YkwD
VFATINRVRQDNGLPALKWNASLQAAAEKYAALVRDTGQVAHDLDGAPWDRARREGYPSSFVAEVIAMQGTSEALAVQREADGIVRSWMDSPPHHAIILASEYSDLGVGCATGRTADGLNTIYCVALTGAP